MFRSANAVALTLVAAIVLTRRVNGLTCNVFTCAFTCSHVNLIFSSAQLVPSRAAAPATLLAGGRAREIHQAAGKLTFFVCLLRDLLALKAVLPFNAVVAGGWKVAQSVGKVASLK